MPSLLVTNDFPPKIGGIQSYLFELWRRLPPDQTTVLTTNYENDKGWDATRRFRVVRASEYSAREAARAARRPLPGVVVPPGVDSERFRPIDIGERLAVRRAFGLDE